MHGYASERLLRSEAQPARALVEAERLVDDHTDTVPNWHASAASCPACGEPLHFGRAVGRVIRQPRDIAGPLVPEMSSLEREELRVALLTTRNAVLSIETVYVGNVSASVVRIGELFTEAVRRLATAVLIIHNHPSGDPTPSPDDLHLTAEAIAAGRLLDIAVLDHIVIGGGEFVSLRERGVTFGVDRPGRAWDPESRLGAHDRSGREAWGRTTARDQTGSYLSGAVEAVGLDWLPCACTHGRPAHSEAERGHCLTEACTCAAYTLAPAAPVALGAGSYGRAWEPLPRPDEGRESDSCGSHGMARRRRYLSEDVHAAALDRLTGVYRAGHRVVVSISGGKDSTACLELCRIAARLTGRLPVEAMHRDDEIMTPGTFEYLDRVANDPEIRLHHWYSREPVGFWFSRTLPFYWPFDPELPPARWMRQPPPYAEEVVEHLPWYVNLDRFPPDRGRQLVSVLGLRAQESPMRLWGIHASGGWLTRPNRVGAVVARPVYDWSDSDVWRFLAESGADYNRAYDVMHAAGIPPRRLRISSVGCVFSSTYDHPQIARAFPGWAAKLERRLGPDLARIAALGAKALRPEHRDGETWAATLQRECLDNAPAWIGERTGRIIERARSQHVGHRATTDLPDDKPCPRCAAYGSYRVIAQYLFWGAPWGSGWLRPPDPEQFRPDRLGRLG